VRRWLLRRGTVREPKGNAESHLLHFDTKKRKVNGGSSVSRVAAEEVGA
jgi:hypothetical protein